MALIVDGKVLMKSGVGGNTLLKFKVKGTYFPVKNSDLSSSTDARWQFYSGNSEDNKIYIDFADGTGEHVYDFGASGSNRAILFRSISGVRSPEDIFETGGWYSAPGHFYQDLPEGIRGTIDNSYDYEREISIRFEKPELIVSINLFGTRVFSLPASLSKLRGMYTLSLVNLYSVETFPQDFYRSFIRSLTLSTVGSVMDSGFPQWIINSSWLEVLNVQSSINLSGDPVTKGLSAIGVLKDTLLDLRIGGSQINYKIPNEIGELINLTYLDVSINTSPDMRLPDNIGEITHLETLGIRNTRMPVSEIQRILNLSNVDYIRLSACQIQTDIDISSNNTTLKRIEIGGNGNTWNSGQLPSFLTKLKALETLDINDVGSSLPQPYITSWIDLTPISHSLRTIYIARVSDFTTTIPDWFDNAIALKMLYIYASFQNSGGVDSWINNFYAKVVDKASMVTGNTLLRSMTVSQVSSNTTDNNNTTRPSGLYQQPSGYVQGVSNGTPTTPLERVWVLVNQYGHTWQLKP